MPRKHTAPSLESLVNQCCEDYYHKLNQTLDQINNDDTYFSYEKFKDYIQSSHCQENLKFLIEIYHYEKIWNNIFKRQSSILKCKDEQVKEIQIQQQQQRKLSVATIFTNSSSRRRHPSIIELPEPGDAGHSDQPPTATEEQQRMDSIHSLDEKDINKLVNELTIPHMVTTEDDIDARSFVDLDGPRSASTDSPAEAATTSPVEDSGEDDPLVGTKPLTHTHTHGSTRSQRSNPNWNTLFKPAYQCEDSHACLCNVASHEHNHISVPDTPSSEEIEYNENVKQMEVREQLKEELAEKFEFIITYYVLNNSPYEINLPSDVYKDLVQEYENTKILYHSPLTLLPAKNAVLQLLRENIYYKFLSEQERLITKEESSQIIKESQSHQQTTLERPTIATSAPSDPRFIPVRITGPSDTNGTLTRDLKSLRIDTPVTSHAYSSSPSHGSKSSFTTFFKSHLKPSSPAPSIISTDSRGTSPSVNSVQRTQTFAGLNSLSPETGASRQHSVHELAHSSSTGDLKKEAEHGWRKLFKKKKEKGHE